MNWNAVGAIGQILGSVAVFVTIAFLVVQVHDAKSEMQRAIVESRTERNSQINLTWATNERLAAIHMKANAFLQGDNPLPPFIEAATKQIGLTPEEAFMLYADSSARWGNLAQSVLYVEGLPPGDRAQFDRGIRFAFAEPVFRFWYGFQKATLNPDAVRYVDNLLARSG